MVFVPKKLRSGPASRRYGPALSLGSQMAAGMLVFTFLGLQLDKWLGTGDVLTLCGVFLGLTYGGYETWKVVVDLKRSDEVDTEHGDESSTKRPES